MSRWLTTRRSQWMPGVAILGVAAGFSALVGGAMGAHSWPAFLGLVLVALMALGWLERVRLARPRSPQRPRPRGKMKVLQGGKSGYDLEGDQSTESQKYVM